MWCSKKSKTSWTVPQLTPEGGAQVGPPGIPGMHQPSTFDRKIKNKEFYHAPSKITGMRGAKAGGSPPRRSRSGITWKNVTSHHQKKEFNGEKLTWYYQLNITGFHSTI